MILVKPSFEILAILGQEVPEADIEHNALNATELIELAGRTCYKTEDKITSDSAEKFIKMIMEKGHVSVLEHSAATIKIICDRGVTHEIVRHRLVAYSQESTRYCNYAKENEITVVEPFFFDSFEPRMPVQVPVINASYVAGKQIVSEQTTMTIQMNSFDVWFLTCLWTQWGYMTLMNEFNRTPQQARSVLPNSLKTEIVMTANFREWRHILKLRTSNAAHPQMREIMIPILNEFQKRIPVLFDNIQEGD